MVEGLDVTDAEVQSALDGTPVEPAPTNDQVKDGSDTPAEPDAEVDKKVDIQEYSDDQVSEKPVEEEVSEPAEADEKGEVETAPPADDAKDGFVSQKSFNKRVGKLTEQKNQIRDQSLAQSQRIQDLEQQLAAKDNAPPPPPQQRQDDDYVDPYADDDVDRPPQDPAVAAMQKEIDSLKQNQVQQEAQVAEDWFSKQLDNLETEPDLKLMDREKVCMNLVAMQQQGHKITLDDMREQALLSHEAEAEKEQNVITKYLGKKKDQQDKRVSPIEGDAPGTPPVDLGEKSWDELTDIADKRIGAAR